MRYLHPGLWIAASLPLVYLLTQLGLVLSGQANNLGGDPGEAIMSELGRYALWLLIATLAITPLRGIFPRLTPLVRSRRMLGLWVMAYAICILWPTRYWYWDWIFRFYGRTSVKSRMPSRGLWLSLACCHWRSPALKDGSGNWAADGNGCTNSVIRLRQRLGFTSFGRLGQTIPRRRCMRFLLA